MKNNEFNERCHIRKKRCLQSRMWYNLLLLLPPTLLTSALIAFAASTYSASIFLIYFALPMFYTVIYRLRYDVCGIGNPDFSYKDGYKAFFKGPMSGIFGLIGVIISTIAMGLLFYLLFSLLLAPLCGAFGVYDPYYIKIADALNNTSISTSETVEILTQNLPYLTQPLVVLVGVMVFIPLMFGIFYSLDTNLVNHYLCGLILPDIDKNITASQARTLSKGSFGRFYAGYRLSKSFAKNWPFYLIATALYAATLVGMSFVTTENMYLIPFYVSITPGLGVFYFLILNYFCLMNDYITVEESKDVIHSSIPSPMRISIYQTYVNPNYVHGDESAARGCFFAAPTECEYREAGYYANPFTQHNPFNNLHPQENQPQKPEEEKNPFTEEETQVKRPNFDEEPKEDPKGGVVDFSDASNDNKKEE